MKTYVMVEQDVEIKVQGERVYLEAALGKVLIENVGQDFPTATLVSLYHAGEEIMPTDQITKVFENAALDKFFLLTSSQE